MSFAVKPYSVQANSYATYNASESKALVDKFYSSISSAAEISTTKGTGDVLGMTMIPFGNSNHSYGLVAKYSEASTPENPVLRVTSNYGGENVSYDVKINEINPRNASQLEMFALMTWQDDQGITDGGTFGSYQKMKTFSINAEMNGYCSGISDSNAFMGEKKDWIEIIQSIMKDYFGNPMTYAQGLDCQRLIDGMERWNAVTSGAEKEYKSVGDYSEKEWDKFLSETDQKIQNMKEAVKEEIAEAREVKRKQEFADNIDILTARYTTFSSKGSYIDPDSDTEEVVTTGYINRTFYTHESIVCARSGYNSKVGDIEDKFSWRVDFNSDDDYDRTMEFLDRIPEEDNTIFTTREQFWHDFVDGGIDEEEFFEFYETLDHGVANFIKTDENGDSYIDKEMMNSKYFKYFGLQQITTVPWDDLQRGLEQSALRDRGYIHEESAQGSSSNIYDELREVFASSGNEEFRFYGEDNYYSIDEWLQEIIRRAHMGLMDTLFVA